MKFRVNGVIVLGELLAREIKSQKRQIEVLGPWFLRYDKTTESCMEVIARGL